MDTINVFDVDSFFASSQEIKREDLGIPLVPSPEEQTLTTKRKGTKRGQDPQEIDKRNTRRRENQKVACRNYRMRKKEYLSELQAKIQQLEEEKEQLTKENMSYKMNNNNNNYNNNNSPAVDPNVANAISEVARVLSEMQEALNVPTEDSMLEYLLQAFFVTTSKLHNAFLKDVDDLVNPFTQVSLASLGYMPSMDIPEISPIQMGGLWDTFITSANLTQEQGNRLQEFISKITNTDAELRMERGAIDNQIKQFYLHKLRVLPLLGTSTQPSEQLDTKTILEFTWLLNRLKTNIVSQKSLLLNTHPQLSNILTPRQHVTLLVNVCQSRFFEWPYHAQVLRTAWDYVSRSSSSSLEASSIALHHPLSPLSPLSSPSSPYSSPYDPSSPQYMSPPSPPTVVPSIAIPTPVAPFSTTYTFLPTSPSLTPTCAPQISTNANSSIVQSFLTSLNYGVH